MSRIKVISRGLKGEELKAILKNSGIGEGRGVNTKKYAGTLKWDIDPIAFQKQTRDEWDREIKSS